MMQTQLFTDRTYIYMDGGLGGGLIYRWLKKPSRRKMKFKVLFNFRFMVYILLLQIFHIFLTDWLPINILSKIEILEKTPSTVYHCEVWTFSKWKIIFPYAFLYFIDRMLLNVTVFLRLLDFKIELIKYCNIKGYSLHFNVPLYFGIFATLNIK